ncbi:interleukin-6 receptor subunit beta isoform X2 [Siniperca chuatsi]|uniref:interleukin-6 receptor subunit beta isoform X2 n=2 Tax=Siniperca chuatsi TaxID=119488 RepID=UPI001CE1A640|nr:interleukin-6 receptor subunit beta isoform X2 [Siniperca chuatsi]
MCCLVSESRCQQVHDLYGHVHSGEPEGRRHTGKQQWRQDNRKPPIRPNQTVSLTSQQKLVVTMVSARVLQLWVLACLASALPAGGEIQNHLVIAPQSPVLEIGTNFMATCMIINTSEVTALDLYWNLSKTTIAKEQYTMVNRSALNVTVPITTENPEWLFCYCKKLTPYVQLNKGKFIHGILLTKGYRPGKPENLSCMAVQEKTVISPNITCVWHPVGRQTTDVPTTYTLNVRYTLTQQTFNVSTRKNSAHVYVETFPFHMTLDIWVEAHNKLGKVESEHLKEYAGWFVKTNPPSDVKVISEKSFPTSLLIIWTHPIAKVYMILTYQIRFCPNGSQSWTHVPLVDTAKDIQSFRLQNLQPDTVYVIQVCCKNEREGYGYWSNWSTNATERTPEARPSSKPDLWKSIADVEGLNERQVKFICKDPVFANGRIIRFDIAIQDQKVKNGSWESIQVNRSEADSSSSQRKITLLKQIHLADKKSVEVHVIAFNSVGKSPNASLVIPEKAHELPPVEELKVWSYGGQLWLKWKPPKNPAVSEYVVEWVTGNEIDWQRENRSTNYTAIKGNLEKFVCYNVSVYPIYYGGTGKSASKQAFLEQGAPLEGPAVRLKGKPGRNEAELVWQEIPQPKRRGFITNYTIFFTSGTEVHDVTVPGNTTSYTLKSLSGNTKYDTWIRASTIRGSAKGFNHSFTTLKYGEIEGIVVGVSLGFLFIVLMTMLLCIYKKDVIKENFWPRIPNPGESTIGNWSPDYPLKAETPKENCLSGISVLDVDVCDGKCVFEEDKASLPLKKDKYLSEEHSSGIGGSSCMSSPRQSVSDSDEGGDMADTTASTVQYSSVVASSGYKGQTPSSQPQQAIFSRSESTQPLLDSEENPDMLLQEGSRQSQRFHRHPCFTHTAGNEDSAHPADFNQLQMERQEALEPLDFCPLEEDSEQTTPADWPPAAPISSYMPQLGGYRPQ